MEEQIGQLFSQVGVGIAALVILFFAIRWLSSLTKSTLTLAEKVVAGIASMREATMAATEATKAVADALAKHDANALEILKIVARTELALVPLQEAAVTLTSGQERILAELANISVELATIAGSVRACAEAETVLRDDVMREIAALEQRIIGVLNDLARGSAAG